jgi:hypothetical protein
MPKGMQSDLSEPGCLKLSKVQNAGLQGGQCPIVMPASQPPMRRAPRRPLGTV